MAEEKGKDRLLELRLLSPGGTSTRLLCDDLRLEAADNGGSRGGSFGVRRGHIPALAALAVGELLALREGEILLRAHIEGGFARIEGDSVTVLAESYTIL